MSESTKSVKDILELRLKESGLCVWPIGENSEWFRLGFLFGVTVPTFGEDEKLIRQAGEIKNATDEVAKNHELTPVYAGPIISAGGGAAIYCGFKKVA